MGTSLYAIANTSIPKDISLEYVEKKLKELKKLNWDFTKTPVYNDGKFLGFEEDDQQWHYRITNYKGYLEIEFDGDFPFTIDLLPNNAIINSIYRYQTIYQLSDSSFHFQFKKQLKELLTIFSATEIIFVADNSCNKLSFYFDLGLENVTYQRIKELMIEEFGKPVTDYRKLNYDTLSYRNINEFFLEGFTDIENLKKEVLLVGAEGSKITFYKNYNEGFFYEVTETNYDLEELKPIEKQSNLYTTFTEVFKVALQEYPAIINLYPINIEKEIKTELKDYLNNYYTNKENPHFIKWIDLLE